MTEVMDEPAEDTGETYPPIYVSQRELAARMGLTTRWIYDLTGEGVFKQVKGKKYDLDQSHAAYRIYKLEKEGEKKAPSAGETLNKRRDEMLKRRMDREARELITMQEALDTVDKVTGAFVETLSGLPARITRVVAERKRIEEIVDGVRERLSKRFDAERETLRSGVEVGEASEEDDA